VIALLPLGDLVLALSRDGLLTVRARQGISQQPNAWAGVSVSPPPFTRLSRHSSLAAFPPILAQPWSVSDFEAPAQPGVALPAGFVPTCVAHPDAYVNKVLVSAADGRAALLNFVAGRVVHTFAGFGAAVRCVAPSPALDVVAFGLADGRVVVHNIRFDETVATFTHDPAGGAVTAAAFRTGPGPAVLVCGGVSGALSVWDLAAKRLQTVIKEAHDAPVRAPVPRAFRHTHIHTHLPSIRR
jgi:hypothetical protein